MRLIWFLCLVALAAGLQGSDLEIALLEEKVALLRTNLELLKASDDTEKKPSIDLLAHTASNDDDKLMHKLDLSLRNILPSKFEGIGYRHDL